MKIWDVPTSQAVFLRNLQKMFPANNGDNAMAIFVENHGMELIEDFFISEGAATRFEQYAPDGLWRGGVACIVCLGTLTLAVPDERRRWFKPVPSGMISYAEAVNFWQGFSREFLEELFIYTTDNDGTMFRVVPPGLYTPPSVRPAKVLCSSRFIANEIMPAGKILGDAYKFNEACKAFELVVEWDMPVQYCLGGMGSGIVYDDDFARHMREMGKDVPVLLLNAKELVGAFPSDGGFVQKDKKNNFEDYDGYGVHPILAEHLGGGEQLVADIR
ncbi:MAG: hypothetical protein HY432_01985 [Candidatus Liptonbacteria bacterium]|nr:hypothetical protein [Candidatus Liptonbacteria bacterium]